MPPSMLQHIIEFQCLGLEHEVGAKINITQQSISFPFPQPYALLLLYGAYSVSTFYCMLVLLMYLEAMGYDSVTVQRLKTLKHEN